MIGKIKTMAIITFYIAVLLVIAVYLQDGSGTFSHFFENANLYIRNLRNIHVPAFHQTYDNYLQLFPLILLFGLKLGGIRGRFGWKRLFTFIVLSVILTQLVVNGLKLTTGVLRRMPQIISLFLPDIRQQHLWQLPYCIRNMGSKDIG